MQVASQKVIGTYPFNLFLQALVNKNVTTIATRLTIAILSPKNQQKYVHW